MEKLLKSADELHSLIVALVRRYSEYSSVIPNKPYWHERDSNGCNWDLNSWTGPREDVIAVVKKITEEVRYLRGKYDIASPG